MQPVRLQPTELFPSGDEGLHQFGAHTHVGVSIMQYALHQFGHGTRLHRRTQFCVRVRICRTDLG